MRLVLANPRGFCAGVDRAIAIVEQLVEANDEPVFVRHEIVHNRVVVDDLRRRGAVFVEDISEIPRGSLAVVSAHGAPPEVFQIAKARALRLTDATCPLVSKVHLEVSRHARHGRSVVVIGHRSHVEVQGIIGYYVSVDRGEIHVVETECEARALEVATPDRIGYVSQTTLAVDQTRLIIEALRERFPALVDPHAQDICYATQNRQLAVRNLATVCDLILVVGAPHSSNSQRMREVATAAGVEAHLIEGAGDIQPHWISGRRSIGLTSSASAPEHLVQEVVDRIRVFDPTVAVDEFGQPESISFRLPLDSADLSRTGGAAR